MLAAAEFFEITVLGKGAHGSKPELSVDPILVAARVIEALQTIVSRRVSPLDSAVLSICRIEGGTNGNIIPDSVELEGTIRYLNPELGKKLPPWLEQTVNGVCESAGASCDIKYDRTYIPTINHAESVALGREIVEEVMGPDVWVEKEQPSMGGEDFAYYIVDHPGAMFFLGMGEDAPSLHNSCFDFNDEAMGNGIRFLVELALRTLEAG